MGGQEYLKLLGRQLAQELTAHETIRTFVGNHPDLIGKYAEASLHKFIAGIVSPLKVSTGTIIYEGNVGRKPPQLDAIIWSPTLVPAIFENGGFAIIPRGSAHGFLEIKSSSYSGAGKDIASKLAYEDELISSQAKGGQGALGVVCISTKPDRVLHELVKKERAVILLTMHDDGKKLNPNPAGIFVLINYLTKLRRFAKEKEGRESVNVPLISGDE